MTITSATQNNSCGHCGMIHLGPCLRIKSIEYYPDGTMKRVEYHVPMPVIIGTPSRQPLGDYTITIQSSQCSGESNNCEQDEGA